MKINPDKIVLEYRNVLGDPNSLWGLDAIRALVDGQEVGELRISYVPSARIGNWREDVFSFLADRGQMYDMKVPKDFHNASTRELAVAMHAIQRKKEGWKAAEDSDWYSKSRNEILQGFEHYREQLTQEMKPYMEDFIDIYIDKPMVDYIQVHPDFRRQGIAYTLYKAGAEWMQERNLSLHDGLTQSPEAQMCWKYMEQRGLVEVMGETAKGTNRRRIKPM